MHWGGGGGEDGREGLNLNNKFKQLDRAVQKMWINSYVDGWLERNLDWEEIKNS